MPGVLRVIWKDVSTEKMLLSNCLVICVLPWSMIDVREHSQLWAGDPGVLSKLVELAMRCKPVTRSPPWSLLQFLPGFLHGLLFLMD